MSAELTEKQKAVWDYLIKYVEDHGYQPSIQEMANHFDVDKNAIYARIKHLAHKGWLTQNKPKRDRALIFNKIRFTSQTTV